MWIVNIIEFIDHVRYFLFPQLCPLWSIEHTQIYIFSCFFLLYIEKSTRDHVDLPQNIVHFAYYHNNA